MNGKPDLFPLSGNDIDNIITNGNCDYKEIEYERIQDLDDFLMILKC